MTEYRRGFLDGLAEAEAIAHRLKEQVEALLDKPAARATRDARRTRHQAYKNVTTRIGTTRRRRQRGLKVLQELDRAADIMDRMGL